MNKISRRKFIFSGLLTTLGLLLVNALFIERFFIELKEFLLADKREGAVSILQLSDLHLKGIKWKHRLLVDKINNLQPDLIVITGDAIDDKENLPLLETFLESLNLSIPKVAILGNWEYWGGVDLDKLKTLYRRQNCTLLINRSRQYQVRNRSVAITGIDDLVGGKADYQQAIRQLKASDYHIVLTHCPAHRDRIALEKGSEKIDLILSGHTHGGQINLLGFAPFKPNGSGRYVKGWYREEGLDLFVSKGIGTSVLPFRFGARAEVAVFYL